MNASGMIDLVPQKVRQQWINDGTYANQSVYALFCRQVALHPEQAAVVALDYHLSYAQLLDKVQRLAASLAKLGVVAGDVVAYQLNNHWHSTAINLAVAALGAIVAPYPP